MMNPLLVKAIKKASLVRMKLGLDIFEPINIFDACISLRITVRFVDINMEGMYISHEDGINSTILLSNQRPLPRRIFTCAHELGHQSFQHGTKIDALTNEATSAPSNDKDEFLVDAFAGALLMPIAGIQAEFIKRNWETKYAFPIQFYIICTIFGTGYTTLITHCRVNRLINDVQAKNLLRHTPAKILESLLGPISVKSYFKIIDNYASLKVIDLEVSNYIFFPPNIQVEGNHLKKYQETEIGIAYVANRPSIIRVSDSDNKVAYFVRIQNSEYIGLAENRHLENITD